MEKIKIHIAIPFEFYKWTCTAIKCGLAFITILPDLDNGNGTRGLIVWGNENNPPHCPRCGLEIETKNPITETG